MKFQNPSKHGSEDMDESKRVTNGHTGTNMPHQLLRSWGHNYEMTHYLPLLTNFSMLELPRDVPDVAWEQITFTQFHGSSCDYHQ